MQCVICKQGETRLGRAMVVLERDTTTVVNKGVPVDACENCGEYYPPEEMMNRVLAMAEGCEVGGGSVQRLRQTPGLHP
jgi:YgiT-type zinc finger domain-containing protein